MVNWFSKENVPKAYKERLEELESEVLLLKKKVKNQDLDIQDLTNKVLRKIQYKKPVAEEEESQDLYSKVLIKSKE